MRLGQLARKLDLRPREIVEFLATKDIRIEEGTNSKVEDELVRLTMQHFAPHLQEEENPSGVEAQPIVDPIETAEVVMEAQPEAVVSADDSEPVDHQVPEVIKAPKVELSGLKVLGKIELPEPRKKEADAAAENIPTEVPKELKRGKRNENFKRRPAKNPIAFQREQEALAAQQKREEEIRLLKERRTQRYLKKVKVSQPTKAAKIIREQTEEMSAAELAEPPKTWWGKFKRWLTS